MALGVLFLFGIANFALHRAVLASGHAAVRAMVGTGPVTSRLTLGLEFAVLVVAMLAARADPAWAWAYAACSAFNALAAWAILSRRI